MRSGRGRRVTDAPWKPSAVGAILIRRTRVRPFTATQIALLKTFADQAYVSKPFSPRALLAKVRELLGPA